MRFLFDENGRAVEEAGPGTAVEVVGWKELPSAGELLLEVESEVRAPPTHTPLPPWREERGREGGEQGARRIEWGGGGGARGER